LKKPRKKIANKISPRGLTTDLSCDPLLPFATTPSVMLGFIARAGRPGIERARPRL
jgi:hypothetical protein